MSRIHTSIVFLLVVITTQSCQIFDNPDESEFGMLPHPVAISSPVPIDGFSAGDGKFEIGEPFVLYSDGPIGAYDVVASSDRVLTARFESGELPLVAAGTYDDIVIGYTAPSSCSEDVAIWNVEHERWDPISHSIPNAGCWGAITYHELSVRAAGLDVSEYVSASGITEVRSEGGHPDSMSVELWNPDYMPIRLAIEPPDGGVVRNLDGLTYDGSAFWISSNANNKIYQISPSGRVLREVDSPSRYPFGLAFDGESLWLGDGTDQIFRLNLQGVATGSFTVPTDCPGGLTYGDSSLWLAEYESGTRLFRIDPVASLSAGVAAITDSFHVADGNQRWGLAWDGEHLIMAIVVGYGVNAEVIRLATDGTVIERLPESPFRNDVAWAEGRLWGIVGDTIVGYDLPDDLP